MVANSGAAYISLIIAHRAIEHLNLALGNAVRTQNWAAYSRKIQYTDTFFTLVNNVSATGIVIDNGTNEISMVILNGATTHVKY